MKYLFLGDTHGDLNFTALACEFARDHGVNEIVQVGDWGYIWPGADKVERLAVILNHHGVVMRFIDGNHDDHPRLFVADLPLCLRFQKRGSLGGAPSIDRDLREPGKSWWATEEITEMDAIHAGMHAGADVVVTHDARDYPPGFRPLGDDDFRARSAYSMGVIDSLVRRYSPKLHVHGHWHHRYKQDTTIGLGCNTGRFGDAVLLWEAS